MAYNFHIERKNASPISLSEWLAAISTTEYVRLFAGESHTVTNSTTGAIVYIEASPGDAQVLLSDGKWQSAFRWREGSAVFAARDCDPTSRLDRIWQAAVELATRLSAVIRGDDGEQYDLRTGKAIDAR